MDLRLRSTDIAVAKQKTLVTKTRWIRNELLVMVALPLLPVVGSFGVVINRLLLPPRPTLASFIDKAVKEKVPVLVSKKKIKKVT